MVLVANATCFDKKRYLVLICIMKEESIKKKGLIDYNCGVFQDALAQVFGLQRP